MIHYWLADLLDQKIPELPWKVNNYSDNKDKGIVYTESPAPPDQYERATMYPEYMIYIRCQDGDKAFLYAYKAERLLREQRYIVVNTEFGTFYLSGVEVLSGPIRIGWTDDKIMEYSVNIRATVNALN